MRIKYGIRIKYYNNNFIEDIYHFKNDVRNGEVKWWYDNGQVQAQSYYIDDTKNGEYRLWYENGIIFKHIIYKNGKIVEEI